MTEESRSIASSDKYFPGFCSFQSGFGAHHTFCPLAASDRATRAWNWPLTKQRNCEDIPPLPRFFMVWYLIKYGTTLSLLSVWHKVAFSVYVGWSENDDCSMFHHIWKYHYCLITNGIHVFTVNNSMHSVRNFMFTHNHMVWCTVLWTAGTGSGEAGRGWWGRSEGFPEAGGTWWSSEHLRLLQQQSHCLRIWVSIDHTHECSCGLYQASCH